jgi:putative solute:sodium symporter small subunit
MIDDRQRSRYWLHTMLLAAGVAVLTVACSFVLPPFAREFNTGTLLGFPLGFYIAAQGIVIVLIIAVYWSGSRQAQTDRKFGAIDDM